MQRNHVTIDFRLRRPLRQRIQTASIQAIAVTRIHTQIIIPLHRMIRRYLKTTPHYHIRLLPPQIRSQVIPMVFHLCRKAARGFIDILTIKMAI